MYEAAIPLDNNAINYSATSVGIDPKKNQTKANKRPI
jgi:hypothetical protein